MPAWRCFILPIVMAIRLVPARATVPTEALPYNPDFRSRFGASWRATCQATGDLSARIPSYANPSSDNAGRMCRKSISP
jgi:hypothetical protein